MVALIMDGHDRLNLTIDIGHFGMSRKSVKGLIWFRQYALFLAH
jgi:hypothetical protein